MLTSGGIAYMCEYLAAPAGGVAPPHAFGLVRGSLPASQYPPPPGFFAWSVLQSTDAPDTDWIEVIVPISGRSIAQRPGQGDWTVDFYAPFTNDGAQSWYAERVGIYANTPTRSGVLVALQSLPGGTPVGKIVNPGQTVHPHLVLTLSGSPLSGPYPQSMWTHAGSALVAQWLAGTPAPPAAFVVVASGAQLLTTTTTGLLSETYRGQLIGADIGRASVTYHWWESPWDNPGQVQQTYGIVGGNDATNRQGTGTLMAVASAPPRAKNALLSYHGAFTVTVSGDMTPLSI